VVADSVSHLLDEHGGVLLHYKVPGLLSGLHDRQDVVAVHTNSRNIQSYGAGSHSVTVLLVSDGGGNCLPIVPDCE